MDIYHFSLCLDFPGGSAGKEYTGFNPWVQEILWRRELQPTAVFLPGEFHGQRRLVGYSPWGCKELDTTEQLTLSLVISLEYVFSYIYYPFLTANSGR